MRINGIEMSNRAEFLLEFDDALGRLSLVARCRSAFLKVCKDEGLCFGRLKLPEGGIEFFFGVFPDFRKEKHHEDVGIDNR